MFSVQAVKESGVGYEGGHFKGSTKLTRQGFSRPSLGIAEFVSVFVCLSVSKQV